MAIIGEILVILFGLVVLIGGTIVAFAYASFSGKGGWLMFCKPIAAGLTILWAACHYGPITLIVK